MGALDYKTRRHRRNRLAAELAATYSPRRHFRLGQDIGWHWQFDNPLTYVGPTYMYQDTAGTTPVTAVGQGIGLLLGREYGGVRLADAKATGAIGLLGAATAATYNTSTGAGTVTRVDGSNQSYVGFTGVSTQKLFEFSITNSSAASLFVRPTGFGTGVLTITAGQTLIGFVSGSANYYLTGAGGGTQSFTINSFREVPGTHLTQATGTAKPTLSARVNLLSYTEQMDNAAWLKQSSGTATVPVVTGAYAASPRGTMTACRVQMNAGDGTGVNSSTLAAPAATYLGGSYAYAIWLATNDGSTKTVSLSHAGAGATNVTVTPTWQRFAVNATLSGSFNCRVQLGAGLGTSTSVDLLVWGADLRTADDAAKNIPAYQRVGATASDHDTDGFPHYAEGDGTDNCWASVGTMDGSATDKLTVVAAVTKNSDAAGALLLELTADSNSNNGAFFISAPQSAAGNFGFKARGTVVSPASGYNAATYAAPTTRVLGLAVDLAASVKTNTVRPYIDAVLDQGEDDGAPVNFGGNFANATLYALSRGGSSGRFNGRFYGSTGRFGPMSDSERNNLTRWWQKRIGTA